MDSTGLLQDSAPPAGRFRPFASAKHRVTRGRYITSNDSRGYIPVYEYPLNGQWIMMDTDDGYILWTGIWKALGNAKADIVKMLESQPDLAPQLRRVRGGYLKIQGTWMPYEVAMRLARRVAWPIREDLIPLFGPNFPSTCLSPSQPGYGQILNNPHGKRRGRRSALPPALTPALVQATAANAPSTSTAGYNSHNDNAVQHAHHYSQHHHYHAHSQQEPGPSGLQVASTAAYNPITPQQPFLRHQYTPTHSAGPYTHGVSIPVPSSMMAPPSPRRQLTESQHRGAPDGVPAYLMEHSTASPPHPSPSGAGGAYSRPGSSGSPKHIAQPQSPRSNRGLVGHVHGQGGRERSVSGVRYTPYGQHPRRRSSSFAQSAQIDLPPLTIPSGQTHHSLRHQHSTPNFGQYDRRSGTVSSSSLSIHDNIVLPPIHSLRDPAGGGSRARTVSFNAAGGVISLPPISSLDEGALSASRHDSTAVLRRLTLDDDGVGKSNNQPLPGIGDAEDTTNSPSHVKPTHEQLWTRRRSLSAPPLHPDSLPRQQDKWPAPPGSDYRPHIPPSHSLVHFHEKTLQERSRRPSFLRHAVHRSSLSSASALEEPSTRDPSPVTPRDEGRAEGTDSEQYIRNLEEGGGRVAIQTHSRTSSRTGAPIENDGRDGVSVREDSPLEEDGERTPRQMAQSSLRSVSASYGVVDRGSRAPMTWRVTSPVPQSDLSSYRFGDANRAPLLTGSPTTGRRSPGVPLACRQNEERIPVEDMEVDFHSSVTQGTHARRMGSW